MAKVSNVNEIIGRFCIDLFSHVWYSYSIKKGGVNFMKSTGIVRKVDELGRVVLPIELRRSLDIEEKDALEIYVDGNSVILKKYEPDCISACLRDMKKTAKNV